MQNSKIKNIYTIKNQSVLCPVWEARVHFSPFAYCTALNFLKFSFFTFPPQVCKNILSDFSLQNYTSSVVGDGGRDLAPATAVDHGGRVQSIFKNL
jgi:hypothetical protein